MSNKKSISQTSPAKLDMESIRVAAEKLDKDYTIFCGYMEQKTPKLSPGTMRLGKKDCYELNQLLQCVPEPWQKAGRTQEYYTEIDFFYYFSLCYGIFYPVYKPKVYQAVFTDKRGKFFKLTPIERYGIMLECMLWEYQDENQRMSDYFAFSDTMNESSSDASGTENFFLSRMANSDSCYLSMPRLYCLFSLFHIEWKKNPDAKDKNTFRSITLTDIGIKIIKQFIKEYTQNGEDEFLYSEYPLLADPDSEAVSDFLSIHEMTEDITFLLKVTLGNCIRMIKISGESTLEDLHLAIQKAVDFDNDHLYCFEIGYGKACQKYYHSSFEEEPLIAEETELRQLPLYEKSTFKYLFDFGDNWLFDIKVEKILPEKTNGYSITEKKGESPSQYQDMCW